MTDEYTVCGEIDHSRCEEIADIARAVLPRTAISARTSGFDGRPLLRLSSETVDLESDQGSDDLIGGAIIGTTESARAILSGLSAALESRRIRHLFELYDVQGDLLEKYRFG